MRPDGYNVWEIIDAAATKPFGFMPFYPGRVWAGTAFYRPFYLSWKTKQSGMEARFIELEAISTPTCALRVDKIQNAERSTEAAEGSHVMCSA